MTRIATGEHRDILIHPHDVVVFSSDPIPGNEESVTTLIDTLLRAGAEVLYSEKNDHFHVSGHGSKQDLALMIELTTPRFIVPVSGMYKHMSAYKDMAKSLGYKDENIILPQNGQEIIFTKNKVRLGRKIPIKNIFVDQISGDAVEGVVLRDRERLAKEGIVIALIDMNIDTGQISGEPDIIVRGFSKSEGEQVVRTLKSEVKNALQERKATMVNIVHARRFVEDICEKSIYQKMRRRPLILPLIIEA